MRLAYWMYEGTAHHGVGRITNSLRGTHAVFHAPQGDDYVNPIFTMLERTPAFPQMTTSVVSGRDLAQGTIRLPETLRQVEANLHPELIVVCASCSTILLQEDLQVVADSANVRADVLVYDANPYRMQEVLASEGLNTELVKRYAAPQPLTDAPSVNILGMASLGFHNRHDLICLRRMLGTLGIQINTIAPWGASLADLRRLPAAWVNIAPYRELGFGGARYLEEQFGTPLLAEAPIGVQPTLAWLKRLVAMVNEVGARVGKGPEIKIPPLTAFSLDGLSAPSGVPWFARTADMESFSSKTAYVFGDATHTVGMVKFLRDELAMNVAGAGTYLRQEAAWVREQLEGYVDDLLVTDRFQDVARLLADIRPDLVCGTQMERHSCRKLDLDCMVIAPPTHIENHLLAYRPFLGFDGADNIADEVYTTTKLGLEKHLIDMFGDAGLEHEEQASVAATEPVNAETPAPLAAEGSADAGGAADQAAQTPERTNAQAVWSPEATAMLKKVPFFVRGRVQKNVERYAAQQGYTLVTPDVVLEAKEALGA
jgi:light-independent protochlorophyllide reductase subunit B